MWEFNASLAFLLQLSSYGGEIQTNGKQVACAAHFAVQDATTGNSAIVPTMRAIIPGIHSITAREYDTKSSRREAIRHFSQAVTVNGVDAILGPPDSASCQMLSIMGSVLAEVSIEGTVRGNAGQTAGYFEGFRYKRMNLVAAYVLILDKPFIIGY